MSRADVALRYTLVQFFSLAFGLVYLAVAVSGWALTGLHGDAELIVFHVNPLHNIIHTVVALVAIAGSRTARSASWALIALGVVLGLVTVLGFFGMLDMLGMTSGIADPDNFLHLVTGALALVVGLQYGPDDDV